MKKVTVYVYEKQTIILTLFLSLSLNLSLRLSQSLIFFASFSFKTRTHTLTYGSLISINTKPTHAHTHARVRVFVCVCVGFVLIYIREPRSNSSIFCYFHFRINTFWQLQGILDSFCLEKRKSEESCLRTTYHTMGTNSRYSFLPNIMKGSVQAFTTIIESYEWSRLGFEFLKRNIRQRQEESIIILNIF